MVLPKRVRTVKWENGILTLDNDKKFEGTEENYYQDKEIESIIQNHFVLSEKQRALFYGAFDHDVNTIGGYACWVQDWEYRKCPECGKKILYLAQIHWDTLDDYAEGTLYIEICLDCKIITMFHQQT